VDERELRAGLVSCLHVAPELNSLSSILALARLTSSFNLVRPKMVEEPVLEIRQGRHILQERWVDHYIRNDTMMCGGSDSDQHHSMVRIMTRLLGCYLAHARLR
jgi:DNA mismatch repair protein MSH5